MSSRPGHEHPGPVQWECEVSNRPLLATPPESSASAVALLFPQLGPKPWKHPPTDAQVSTAISRMDKELHTAERSIAISGCVALWQLATVHTEAVVASVIRADGADTILGALHKSARSPKGGGNTVSKTVVTDTWHAGIGALSALSSLPEHADYLAQVSVAAVTVTVVKQAQLFTVTVTAGGVLRGVAHGSQVLFLDCRGRHPHPNPRPHPRRNLCTLPSSATRTCGHRLNPTLVCRWLSQHCAFWRIY